jgi:hypothetical protein
MIWFYSRNDQELRIETDYDKATREYVMTIRGKDSHTSERFTDVTAFRARLIQLEHQLEAEKWSAAGPVVSEAWRRRSE